MKVIFLVCVCLALALSAQAPNSPCPSLAPIHFIRGNLDGYWWHATTDQERRVYIEGYADAGGHHRAATYILPMTYLTNFYADPTHLDIPVKETMAVFLKSLRPEQRR